MNYRRTVVIALLIVPFVSIFLVAWYWRNPSGKTGFLRIFGDAPPAKVSSVWIKRYYAGGPGDQTIIMKFSTDQETIDGLTAKYFLQEDIEVVRRYSDQEGGWCNLWVDVMEMGIESAGSQWDCPNILGMPIVFRRNDIIDFAPQYIVLLYDPASQIAYVLFLLG